MKIEEEAGMFKKDIDEVNEERSLPTVVRITMEISQGYSKKKWA